MSTARLSELKQLSCKIFSTVYNPTCARTGNKILRQRLLGPTLTGYHPKPLVHFRDIQALYPQLGLIDVDEKARLDEIARRKRRGKGAPKKGKLRHVVTSLLTLLCIKVKANVHPTRRNNNNKCVHNYNFFFFCGLDKRTSSSLFETCCCFSYFATNLA